MAEKEELMLEHRITKLETIIDTLTDSVNKLARASMDMTTQVTKLAAHIDKNFNSDRETQKKVKSLELKYDKTMLWLRGAMATFIFTLLLVIFDIVQEMIKG